MTMTKKMDKGDLVPAVRLETRYTGDVPEIRLAGFGWLALAAVVGPEKCSVCEADLVNGVCPLEVMYDVS